MSVVNPKERRIFPRTIQDPINLYKSFIGAICGDLGLPDDTENCWESRLPSPLACRNYFVKNVSGRLGVPLMLILDEIDRLFDAPFRSDFFGMIRGLHDSRARISDLSRVDLILVTSTDPHLFITNTRQSPFNVGDVIDLEHFTREQVEDLDGRHGRPFGRSNALSDIYELVSGHPFLTRRAMFLVADGRFNVRDLFAQCVEERGPFGDHLRFHLGRIRSSSSLKQALHSVFQFSCCSDTEALERLEGAGIVKREGKKVSPRCQLYARYFAEHVDIRRVLHARRSSSSR
jgi:hypothetical protein